MAMTKSVSIEHEIDPASPYNLAGDSSFLVWRAHKLETYPNRAEDLVVPISDPSDLSVEERQKIFQLCEKANMAIYRTHSSLTKEETLHLSKQIGLHGLDLPLFTKERGMTEITTVGSGRQGEYAPYTDRALSWHTDGYYNSRENQVLGMVLHCKRAAAEGGKSSLLDPEIAYIHLRDENPDYIAAMMELDALTIPENIENGQLVRPAETGPVFSVINDRLHMRYSARKKYIEWKPGKALECARDCLTELLAERTGPVIHYRLAPGEGLISNNILHTRSAFEDGTGERRLLYRARFKSRVFDAPMIEINGDE
jgi:alpha-ketoglutarate-dependent taurine dioxygenase